MSGLNAAICRHVQKRDCRQRKVPVFAKPLVAGSNPDLFMDGAGGDTAHAIACGEGIVTTLRGGVNAPD
jgi:hypothetical protein